MSISSELLTLQNTKTAIRTAINNKGGSVEASAPFASYATAIDNLPSGGSGNPLLTSIDVSDFTGTTFNDARTYITDVTIPSGVTSIGNNAFLSCERLTSVTIPNSVTSIGNYAFSASGITSLPIMTNVTSMGNYVFSQCAGLTGSITVPRFSTTNDATTVSTDMFANCNNITSATLTEGQTVLPNSMFNSCASLTSVNIPSTVTKLGNSVFYHTALTGVVIVPSGVTEIGTQCFQSCNLITALVLLPTTPPYKQYASSILDNRNYPIYVPAASVDTYKAADNWRNYASRIVAIEDSILFTPTNGDPAISVKNYELASANYVQSTDVPSTIKNGAGALEICEGVDRIGISALRNGSSLTSVTLPSTLTRIDELAFDGCSSLTSVTVNATTPPTLYAAAFGGSYPIYVPAESVDAYKAADNWSTYASRIEAIPAQEHALFAPASQTATITPTEIGQVLLTFPIRIYYADGTEMTNTYHLSNGTVRQWNAPYPTGIIDDPNGELYDTTVQDTVDAYPVYDSTNGWTMKYDLSLIMDDPDDPSPFVGKTVTFSATGGMSLPRDYAEVDGTWVQVRDQEVRNGSFTVTITGIDQTDQTA